MTEPLVLSKIQGKLDKLLQPTLPQVASLAMKEQLPVRGYFQWLLGFGIKMKGLDSQKVRLDHVESWWVGINP